jgi:hypothetical protein
LRLTLTWGSIASHIIYHISGPAAVHHSRPFAARYN